LTGLDLPIAFSNGIIAPMRKGYAFGFLLVLLILILGLYVAFTGFMSSREALRAQPVSRTNTKTVRESTSPTQSSPTDTTTAVSIPTPALGTTITPTIVIPTPASEAPAATVPPAPAPTEPPAAQPTDTLAPAEPPTPVPAPAYQFRLGGPPTADPNHPNCCYIFGTVRDAAGNPLEGVLVQAFNEWNTLPPAATKGGGEAGQYNIPIGHDPVTWYVVVVDASGNYISTQTPISFDPNVAGSYRVDWQRTY
jgi:hypothetical protein